MNGSEQWQGLVLSIQPRIHMTRSFDQRSHQGLGYLLRVRGTVGMERGEFMIAITPEAQEQHQIRAGDTVVGTELSPADSLSEIRELYEAIELKAFRQRRGAAADPPPFQGIPPPLEVYEQRGCRRLDAGTYATTCTACIWGCEMAVEMIIDHWNPSEKDYRAETFCFGPKSCPLYEAGATRKVPGRKGMWWEEEDWVDEDATAHREPDE